MTTTKKSTQLFSHWVSDRRISFWLKISPRSFTVRYSSRKWAARRTSSWFVGGSFSAKVPKSSAEVRRVFIHDIVEIGVGQYEQQGDQRDDEERKEVNGEVKEIKNSTHNEMTHARAVWDECEPELLSSLGPDSVRTLKQGKQSRDDDTNNKEERLQIPTSSAVVRSTTFMSHWLMYSWVSTCFSSLRMLLCLSLCTLCHQFNCCQCTKFTHFLTCTRIPCRDSHCKNGLVRCCLYNSVGCSRPPSTVNDPTATK